MAFQASEAGPSTLTLPRILCLHGGGTNARIFRLQCRVLERVLQTTFRMCFAEAPFPSQPGPDVTSVYKDFGPFRAWFRWRPEDAERDTKSALERIEESLSNAMVDDDRNGATGEWVALLGFSQGAKMCASLLYAQQLRSENLERHEMRPIFRFAVLLAGRGPLVSLDSECTKSPGLVDASSMSIPGYPDEQGFSKTGHLLRIPTIHVHGMQDPGLQLHRKLLQQYCDRSFTRLIEWGGDHRVPIKTKDVNMVVEEMIAMARASGCLESGG